MTALLCNKKVQDKLKLDLTGLSCADIYLHSIELVGQTKNPPTLGTPPDGLPRVAQALTRTEPSQKNDGQWRDVRQEDECDHHRHLL